MEQIKNIAVLTGATGGLGYAFLKELQKENLDEIWAIGRNSQKLDKLAEEFGESLIPMRLDLTEDLDIRALNEALKKANPHISFLINNAGVAQMKPSKDLSEAEIENTINLNCKAPAIISNICLPYMKRGSRIINISSEAAFQPTPYINLYAATKAFLRSYSRAMNVELKSSGITVTAVCPGWIDTEFLVKVINGKKVKFGGLVVPEKVAKKALKDAKKGKDMSVCTLYVKLMHLNVKFFPQKLTMKIWTNSIKKYF